MGDEDIFCIFATKHAYYMEFKNMIKKRFSWLLCLMMVALVACTGQSAKQGSKAPQYVDKEGNLVEKDNPNSVEEALPFTEGTGEKIFEEHGMQTIRAEKDEAISHPEKMVNRDSCFIVMSKKDYYLYVYEPQGQDTMMLARYDCCFSLKKGQKEKSGDMRTPHCSMESPFIITQIVDASGWEHDFGDGRGSILAYGHYFHRLQTPGHSGIGIHGSTNNAESVPGRASEGCIRLNDDDIIDLEENYSHVGMKVVIKAEEVDDLPFEIHAMKKQKVERKRHLDPAMAVDNSAVEMAEKE